jgi:hypothetical protein
VDQGEELDRARELRTYLRTQLDGIPIGPLSAYLAAPARGAAAGHIAKWSFGLGVAAVVLVAAIVVGGQLRTMRGPTSASAIPSLAPFGISPNHGLIAMTRDGFVVRRETDPAPIRRIEPTSHVYDRTIAISRSGRLVAYWRHAAPGEPLGDVLMLYDAVTNADPRQIYKIQNELGGPLVWADDDSGIAFASSLFRGPSPGPPTWLSVVEIQGASAAGQARRIAQADGGRVLVPLAWIRETQSVSAIEGDASGVATTYLLLGDGGHSSTPEPQRVAISSGDQVVRIADVVANQQSRMLAYLVTFTCQDGTPGCTLIRFWALEDPKIAIGWQNTPGSTFVGLLWRPYSRDLLVRTRDDQAGLINGAPVVRLEIWNSSGYGSSRSLAPLPPHATEFFVRPDGRSLFIAAPSNGWPATLYDLTSFDSVKTDLTTPGAGNPHYSVTLSDSEVQRLQNTPGASPLLTDAEVFQLVASRRSVTDRIDSITTKLDRGSYPLGGRPPVWTVKAVGEFTNVFSHGLGPVPLSRCLITTFNARTGQTSSLRYLPNESDCA